MSLDKNKIYNLMRAAYLWGRDNGFGRSKKDFIDFKETSLYKDVFEEKPLIEGEYFMVKEEESDIKFVPAVVFFNMIEQEKYFKFFNGAIIPCRLVFEYYSI